MTFELYEKTILDEQPTHKLDDFGGLVEAQEYLQKQPYYKDLEIVQQNDSCVIYKAKNQEKYYQIIKHIQVVAGMIIQNHKLFATQRGYGKFKDYWEFPGGKMERGETPEQALKRELSEELEIKVDVKQFIKTINYYYGDFFLTMHCFLIENFMGEPNLLEHENAKWLTKDELHSVNWLPADTAVLDDVARLLQ